MMEFDWITLFICGLATFRLSVMLADDSGPWNIIEKSRSFLKREAKQNPTLRKSAVHEGIECLRCNSIWVAFPVAIYGYNRELLDRWIATPCDTFLAWMALSALAILFNRMFPKR